MFQSLKKRLLHWLRDEDDYKVVQLIISTGDGRGDIPVAMVAISPRLIRGIMENFEDINYIAFPVADKDV